MLLTCTKGYLPDVYGIPGFTGTLDAIPDAQRRLARGYDVIKGKSRLTGGQDGGLGEESRG